jgi:NAD(P)-dependent dehydrogenase (short-subunit alcohol dehydrogenase family)
MAPLTRTAIVTGASHGIGLAIAARLIQDGYNVVGCARTPGAAAAALDELSERALGLDADVSRPQDAQRLVDSAVNHFGGLDVLVNNAGVFRTRSFLEITGEEWDEVIAINLTGVFRVSQAAVRTMIATGASERGGGRIVNIASVAAIQTEPDAVPYNTSKGAVISLTRSLAFDLAKHGILTTCVAPGWVDTGIDPALTALSPEQRRRLNPQERAGIPSEVAHAVAMLCDPRASYMNGAIVTVDGGQLSAVASLD